MAMNLGDILATVAGNSAIRRGARGYWDRPTRYDGAALRAIRAEKGVGRPADDVRYGECFFLNEWLRMYHSCPDNSRRNMAEWLRKPRSKRHAA
jgi:hypothetical protein